MPAKASQGLFKLREGSEIYYEDSGGDGPVLLFIYGLGCSIAHWKYSLAFFAGKGLAGGQEFRLVWCDFRGHGASPPSKSTKGLSLDQVATDIHELCLHLHLESITCLGQSLGGSIALGLVRKVPHIVQAVVLLSSPVRDPSTSFPARPLSTWIWKGAIKLNQKAPKLTFGLGQKTKELSRHPHLLVPLRELIRHKGFNPDLAKTEDVEEYVCRFMEVDFQLFCDLAGDLQGFDAVSFASEITCPTLLIAGAKDQIVPLSESLRLLAYLPHGEIEIIEHGSHCPHMDDPPKVNQAILAFLQRHGVATP